MRVYHHDQVRLKRAAWVFSFLGILSVSGGVPTTIFQTLNPHSHLGNLSNQLEQEIKRLIKKGQDSPGEITPSEIGWGLALLRHRKAERYLREDLTGLILQWGHLKQKEKEKGKGNDDIDYLLGEINRFFADEFPWLELERQIHDGKKDKHIIASAI